ncbi:hypothetical protein BD310DRAFT_225293 [Dichomitus squalens]|uniref:Uncharacterized protein n=1 Tax=Dichomitus squalens TaxID=114155 RepID=A0A4Q9PCK3_9APHY|nr:hypothetical protein BD310DRAFT_225293 [Dichomitus squalens]
MKLASFKYCRRCIDIPMLAFGVLLAGSAYHSRAPGRSSASATQVPDRVGMPEQLVLCATFRKISATSIDSNKRRQSVHSYHL